jgi:hypothetical protein
MSVREDISDLQAFFDSLNCAEHRLVDEILGDGSKVLYEMAVGQRAYDDLVASHVFANAPPPTSLRLFQGLGVKLTPLASLGVRLRRKYELRREEMN